MLIFTPFISSHTLSPILREWGLKLKFPSLPAALPVCEFFHILSVVVIRGRCRDSATIRAQLDVGGWLSRFSFNEFFLSFVVLSHLKPFSPLIDSRLEQRRRGCGGINDEGRDNSVELFSAVA